MPACADTLARDAARARSLAAWPPVAATTIAAGLPVTGPLTDALLAAGTTGTLAAAATGARERLERGLAEVLGGSGRPLDVPTLLVRAAPMLRLGHYQVARAGGGQRPPGRPGPGASTGSSFRWTSRAARRSIGLAALRAGLDGRAATPAEAVAMAMSEPAGPLGVGRPGPGSPCDWIDSLAAPARALVAAEATVWTTRLWTAIDWGRLPPQQLAVGGPDRWWRWSDASAMCGVALRGRADVRVEPGLGRDRRGELGGAHLVVLDGSPGAATRQAMLLSALVDALSNRPDRPDRQAAPAPSRVIGWWPDSGKCWVVTVDARSLAAAADAVVSTVRTLLGEGAPGGHGGRH